MKSAAISLSLVLMAGSPVLAADEAVPQVNDQQTPVVGQDSNDDAPAPASIDTIKKKIEAMNSTLAPGVEGVVKMYQSGVEKAVIETYIRNSRLPAPSPRDLIYLHDQGIPQEIVNALIEHGQQQATAQASQPAQATPSYQSAPAIVNIQPSTPTDYSAPQYQTTTPAMSYGYGYGYGYPPQQNYDLVYPQVPQNSSVVIIPYNPYRSFYNSYYSPPFYTSPWYPSYGYGPTWRGYYYGGSYWSFNNFGGYPYCGPYRGFHHW